MELIFNLTRWRDLAFGKLDSVLIVVLFEGRWCCSLEAAGAASVWDLGSHGSDVLLRAVIRDDSY